MEKIIDITNQTDGKALIGKALIRVKNRINKGRAIKPCNYDQKFLGKLIIVQQNHISFENFPELMNDEDYVLELAQLSLNPLDCYNYFFDFVNKHLTKKASFRYKFVCALFLNENIYKLDDLEKIIELLDLNPEFEKAKQDGALKQLVQNRLAVLERQPAPAYHCGGTDKKELHTYKVDRGAAQNFLNNQIDGVKNILSLFNCLTELEQSQKQADEDWFNALRTPTEWNLN